MNIRTILTLSALLLSTTTITIADPGQGRTFKRTDGAKRGGFELTPTSGRLRLCPTGDCNEGFLDIGMERLVEVDKDGALTKNRAEKFKELNVTWSSPITAPNAEGVNVTKSSFTAAIPVEHSNKNIAYKAEIAFFHANGTTLNGKQVVDVPGGSLKFAVWIDDWPFLADTNKLHLGVRVMKKNKKGDKVPKPAKIAGRGRDKLIERLSLDDAGMFLDSPVLAEIDKEMKNITSYIQTEGESVLIEYAFPKFKNLFYDPVLGSTEDADSNLRSDATTTKSLLTVSLATATAAFVMILWL